MLKLGQLLYRSQYSSQTPFFVLHKSFIHVNGSALLPTISRQSFRYKRNLQQNVRFVFMKAGNIKAVAKSPTDKAAASVKAVVTVKLTVGGFLSNLGKDQGLDALTGLLCKTLLLELVSAEIDPSKYSKNEERIYGFLPSIR